MSFCAICTSERGPFAKRPLGRGDADVLVCAKCDGSDFTLALSTGVILRNGIVSSDKKLSLAKARRDRNRGAGECLNQNRMGTHRRPRDGKSLCDVCIAVRCGSASTATKGV